MSDIVKFRTPAEIIAEAALPREEMERRLCDRAMAAEARAEKAEAALAASQAEVARLRKALTEIKPCILNSGPFALDAAYKILEDTLSAQKEVGRG